MTLSSFIDWLPHCHRCGTLDSYHCCGGMAMVVPHRWGKLVRGKGGGILTWAGRTQLGRHHQTSHCHVVSPHCFIMSPQPCWCSFGWWHGVVFGGQQPMWAVDGWCGQLMIDVGGSGHSDHGDGQWWPGVVVDGGLRKREEVCVCVRLWGVFVFGYELWLRPVTPVFCQSSWSSNFRNHERPKTRRSWEFLVLGSLGPVQSRSFSSLGTGLPSTT